MDKDVQQELDIDFGIDQTFRALIVNHPSSCTSLLTSFESSTVTNTVFEIEEVKKSFQINVKLTYLAKEKLPWEVLLKRNITIQPNTFPVL